MQKEWMDRERLRKLEIKDEMNTLFQLEKKNEFETEMEQKMDKERQIMYLEFRNEYEKEI